MKQKIPGEIVGAATTTDGSKPPADQVAGSESPRASGELARRPPATRAEERLREHLDVLRSCAEELLTSGAAGIPEAFARLKPVLGLDALAVYSGSGADRALTLETATGVPDGAFSANGIGDIAADLARSGRRMLLLEALAGSGDARAHAFRDAGFASAVVGALVVDDRLLGAVVLAARSKARFTPAESTLIDTVLCYFAAAYERRDLARHRYNSEHRKREFLTVLAHELRNPLAPVRNALEIIRANDRLRSPVEHSAYAMIERQLQQIGRLADDLLDANQVVLGQLELTKQRVLLDGVIKRAAEQSRPWIEAARHSLVVDLPREPIALDADPKRLARVFSNLVNNAARRMDRGGRIIISAEAAGGTVHVFVRARGRAVSGENMSTIFTDAVARSEVADGQAQGGFTAGMTLVKHLVEMHGGVVSAHTAPDGVDEFEVDLPVAPIAAPVAQRSLPSVEPAGPAVPHRILIADDNADSAESMGMLLRLMGNDVRIASDGLEAVEQAAAFQPEIVLMDIGMPRLDGYEAARRIRDQDWSRDTLLVAVTGWGPSDDSEEAAAAGFDCHFTKPLDPAELRRLVNGLPRN